MRSKLNSQILAKLLQSFPEPRVMRSHKIRGSGDENGPLHDHTKNVVGLQSLDLNESNGNSLSNKLTFPSLDKDPSLRFP